MDNKRTPLVGDVSIDVEVGSNTYTRRVLSIDRSFVHGFSASSSISNWETTT